MKRMWRCIAEDGNGKIHIFCKVLDEAAKPDQVVEFQRWVEAQQLTVLCMYRERDIVEFLELGEEGTGCSAD